MPPTQTAADPPDSAPRQIGTQVPPLDAAVLTENVCWALLSGQHQGRFLFAEKGHLTVTPVTYDVSERTVHFLEPSGRPWPPIDGAEPITFESDGNDGVMVWSVTVEGLPLLRQHTASASAEGLHVRHVQFFPTKIRGIAYGQRAAG
ncbi:hypothetical protein EDF19_3717 [Curtobacterium sp. PhB115]|nr:hypothetical protein EDF19_3717 [Curtobacterium sp. PhB115]